MNTPSEEIYISIRQRVPPATDCVFDIQSAIAGEYNDEVLPLTVKDTLDSLTHELSLYLEAGQRNVQQNSDKPPHDYITEIGRRLFDILDANQALSYTLSRALASDNSHIRLQLRIREPEVRAWPWELLYDSRHSETSSSFLALTPNVLVSHYHEQPIPVPKPEIVEELRVLVLIADYESAGLDEYARFVRHTLSILAEENKHFLRVDFLQPATERSLKDHMTQATKPYHIIHFIGHGSNAGVQFVLDGSNVPVDIDGYTFARILLDSQRGVIEKRDEHQKESNSYPLLVCLDACHSASLVLASVSQAFVDAGIPAVIGMRWRAETLLVSEFNEVLYVHLKDGWPIDYAVAAARLALAKTFSTRIDWIIPALYLRARGGRLFQFNPESHEVEKWLKKLHYVRQLINKESAEAVRALFELGTSTVTLCLAVAMAYPVASVRAIAARLLRALPKTPAMHENIVTVLSPTLDYEQDATVRREVTRLLVQPVPSPSTQPLLKRLLEDDDPEIRNLARLGQLTAPFSYEQAQGFDRVRSLLENLTNDMALLSGMVNEVRPDSWHALEGSNEADYQTYLEYVEIACHRVAILRERITHAEQTATNLDTNEAWDSLNDDIAHDLHAANQAIASADRAARAMNSLARNLLSMLDEVGDILSQELEAMRELDQMTRGLDGVRLSNARGDASISIVRQNLESAG